MACREAGGELRGPDTDSGTQPRAATCVLAGAGWCFGTAVTHSLCPKCGCRCQGRALRVAPNPSTAGLLPAALLMPGAVWVFPPQFVGVKHPWVWWGQRGDALTSVRLGSSPNSTQKHVIYMRNGGTGLVLTLADSEHIK